MYHELLAIALNITCTVFSIKSYLYEKKSISNFAGTICKTNMKSFHVINVSMKLWNTLSNVKAVSLVSFKVYIKTMPINMPINFIRKL